MKRTLFSLLAIATLSLSALGQTQSIRNVQSVVGATFTSASGSAYTAGDAIGTAQTLTNVCDATGTYVTLESVTIKDSAAQNKGIYILFFDGSAPSLTDNAAFAWGSSIPNLVGVLLIDPADYTTIDSKGVLSRTLLNLRMKLANTSKNLSVCAVTASTPTYGNGGTVSATFHFKY